MPSRTRLRLRSRKCLDLAKRPVILADLLESVIEGGEFLSLFFRLLRIKAAF